MLCIKMDFLPWIVYDEAAPQKSAKYRKNPVKSLKLRAKLPIKKGERKRNRMAGSFRRIANGYYTRT